MSDSLLLEDERRIEEREQKATGGRWWWQVSGRFAISLDARRVAPWSTVIQSSSAGMIISDEDKGFISHARTDVPLLLSRLKAEREKNAKISAKMYTAPDIAARGIVQYLNQRYDGNPMYDSTFLERFAEIIRQVLIAAAKENHE